MTEFLEFQSGWNILLLKASF